MLYKKLFLFICLLVLTNISFSQKVEVYVGANQNNPLNGVSSSSDQSGNFHGSSGNGFETHVAIDSIRYEFMVYRVSLGFVQYRSSYSSNYSRNGLYVSEEGQFVASRLVLGLYPMNLRKGNFDLNLGVELGFLVAEKAEGTYSYNNLVVNHSQENEIEEIFGGNRPVSVNLNLRFAYDFYVSQNLAISPIFSVNYALSKEFEDTSDMKSLRWFLGVGVEKTLQKSK